MHNYLLYAHFMFIIKGFIENPQTSTEYKIDLENAGEYFPDFVVCDPNPFSPPQVWL